MIRKPNSLMKVCSFIVSRQRFCHLTGNPHQKSCLLYSTTTTARYSTKSLAQVEKPCQEHIEEPKSCGEVLRRWGCSDRDVIKIFARRPSLRNGDLANLQSKLSLLQSLGVTSSDLVKMVTCRPRFLSSRINHCFEERLEYFMNLFGSKEMLRKAIVRNPSLLLYDFHSMIKPAISVYEEMGLSHKDMIPMLLSRPTMIPRTTFNDEKLEYIRKSGVPRDSKMYKYIVSIIGVSRTDTIREKVANFEKYGFSDEEIWNLFGRSPVLLTLSVDKVQRNMTFVIGVMKFPADIVLLRPYLLLFNLEAVLRPRFLLAGKIEDMGLSPQIKGPLLLRALRMKEKRFMKAFVLCHPQDVSEELQEFYKQAKGVKRLAVASKKLKFDGFPF